MILLEQTRHRGVLPFEVNVMIKKEQIVEKNQEILSGTPVFKGTRVPVQTLIDYLKAGESIEDFLDGFPSVSRFQAEAFLQVALESALDLDEARAA